MGRGVAMKRILSVFVLLSIVGIGIISGQVSALLYGLTDLAFRLAPQQASGQIVIVAIDDKSLARLGPWPWPRRYHADVLDRLNAAGAQQVALDIDLSGRTLAADDQALADAIGRADGRVILPVFKPKAAAHRLRRNTEQLAPYAPFRLGANLGTADVRLTASGEVRQYRLGDHWGGSVIPSLGGLLAGSHTSPNGSFFLDYGIKPDSIPRISFVDILHGNFRNQAIAGKTIIIGAMDARLGDQLRVPVHGSLFGPMVHALAFESLMLRRNIYGVTAAFLLIIAFLVLFAMGKLHAKFTPHTNAGRTAAH